MNWLLRWWLTRRYELRHRRRVAVEDYLRLWHDRQHRKWAETQEGQT